MKQHINAITVSCLYQLQRLCKVRHSIGHHLTAQLVCAFVTSRLDYCNTALASLPKPTIAPLQRAQNAAARLILKVSRHEHVTSALQQLH